MKSLRLLVALLLLPFLSPLAGIRAQDALPGGNSAQIKVHDSQPKKETPEQERRRLLLDSVREIADRLVVLSGGRGGYVDARPLSDLAGQMCRQDIEGARRLFLGTAALLRRQVSSPTLSRDAVSRNWQPLVSAASACDPALGAQLRNDLPPEYSPSDEARQQSVALLEAALAAAASEPAESARLLGQAAKKFDTTFWQQFSTPQLVRFISTLSSLRTKDQKAADALFLSTVAQIRALPSVNMSSLMLVGTYAFCMEPYCDGLSVAGVGVGGGAVYNLSPERPGLPPELAHAYLDAAVDLLLLAKPTETEKLVAYSAAVQLLPKARKYASERVAALEAAIPVLRPSDPQAEADAREKPAQVDQLLNRAVKPPDLQAIEKQAEAEADPVQRDRTYTYLVTRLCAQESFDLARTKLEKIQDTGLRQAYASLIDVREAGQALQAGDAQRLRQVVEHMPAGAERAVLRTGIAAECARSDKQQAIALAFLALHDADSVADIRRPYIKVAVSSVLAKLDSKLALQVFQQAIADFNKQYAENQQRNAQGEPPAATAAGTNWAASAGSNWQLVYITGTPPNRRTSSMSYTVRGKGFSITPSLGSAVAALAESDPLGVKEAVFALADDSRLRDGLSGLARALLGQLAQPAAKTAPQQPASR